MGSQAVERRPTRQLTREHLEHMTSKEISAAHRAGELDDLLGVGRWADEPPLPPWEPNCVTYSVNEDGEPVSVKSTGFASDGEALEFVREVERQTNHRRETETGTSAVATTTTMVAVATRPRAGRAPSSQRRRTPSRARAPDESDEPEPPLRRPARTTHELVTSYRVEVGTRYTCSVSELTSWLQGLADAGILERDGDDWRPTPVGALWLCPVAEAFIGGERVSA